jgi:hypothetical protein
LGFPIKKSNESASVGSGAGFGKPLPSVARRRFIVGQNLFIIALVRLGSECLANAFRRPASLLLLRICRIEGGSEKLWCMDFAGILMRGKAFF